MQITFVTPRFNLTAPLAGVYHPEVYGNDAANWMRDRLKEADIEASEPSQEDWGWYMMAEYEGEAYLFSLTGKSDGADEESPNMGVWILLLEKYRTPMQQLLRRNKLLPDDAVPTQLIRILQMEKDITFLGVK